MDVTNLESIPGRTIVRHLGLVQGSTVRAKHAGRDILAGLKNIVGGELKAYTELLATPVWDLISRQGKRWRPVFGMLMGEALGAAGFLHAWIRCPATMPGHLRGAPCVLDPR